MENSKKTFKDLNIGDSIYYYDHCVMKSKIVTSKPEIVHCKEPITYGWNGETRYREWDELKFSTTPGKPISIYIWNDINNIKDTYQLNSSMHFANKEAAQNYFNILKGWREHKVKKLQKILNQQTAILNKYKFVGE